MLFRCFPHHAFRAVLLLAGAALLLGAAPQASRRAALASHDEVVQGVKSKSQTLGFDLSSYVAGLDATVTTLIDTAPGLGADYPIWILPSRAYAETYVRDSFWTLFGYGQTGYLQQFVEMFARNAQNPGWKPELNGQIPTVVRKHAPTPDDARRIDESTMFWVLSTKLAGKSAADEPYLELAYPWLKTNVTPQGFAMVSHGWIDAWEPVKVPTVSANNQGLYAVTLRALREMGVAVPEQEIREADAAYRALTQGGYVHAYRGSEVVDVSSLLGEALALYLWDESILGSEAVKGTIARFAEVRYRDGDFLGFKCLANPDGSYLDPRDFWEIAEREPGNYQNGASWLLYEALALYAGARHDAKIADSWYLDRLVKRLKSETKYDASSKEFICTGGTCGTCDAQRCFCPDGICGVGSFSHHRSGYGWNAFVKRLVLHKEKR